MNEVLDGLTEHEVHEIIRQSMGGPAMPFLRDPNVQARARETARRQGLLERLQGQLAADKPIPAMPHSLFREFRQTGNRTNYETLWFARSHQVDIAAAACYLGGDHLAYLQDLMWADCEATWWQLPAHEGPARSGKDRPIDLFVAIKAAQLAMILETFGDRIEPEVRRRVEAEIRQRAIDAFFDPNAEFGWKTNTNNWNAVCHGGVGVAAMLLEKDPQKLADLIVQTLGNLRFFLDGFTPDGGCTEGPGYWQFGFGWYVLLASVLYDFTAGRINIMANAKVERVARYPLAVTICPGQSLPFADTGQGFIHTWLAIVINRFFRIPELYGLCRLTQDGSPALEGLQDLMLYDGTRHEPLTGHADALLADLGVVRVRAGDVTVGAKAGHNGEHHNHNDVGSFIVHRGGTFFLTDPGAPVYSAQTFNHRRYESIFCNSFGHSVPVIGGRSQSTGRRFAGTLRAEGLDATGDKRICIEMAGAYDVPSLKRASRVLTLSADTGRVDLADTFIFGGQPEAVEETFITALPAALSPDGRCVTVTSQRDGILRLRAEGAAGTFQVKDLVDESRESRTGDLLRRITFVPAQTQRQMTLRFVMEFAAA
jgi:hypothetical protein